VENVTLENISAVIKNLIHSGLIKNQTEIVNAIGFQKSYLSNIVSGNQKASSAFVTKFTEHYQHIIHKGLETIPPKITSNARPIDLNEKTIMHVPLVTKHAYAGYLAGFGDDEYISSLTTIPMIADKEYKGNYLAFEVKGDSMDNDTKDSYEQGDIVICREVARTHWQSKLHITKYDFIIVTRTEGLLLKRIIKHDTTAGILTMHSLNPMYDDQTVKLDDVAKIFNVVKVIREK
jgi:phage repressor protein C with HTH and peptisase S24 domain